MAPSLPENDGGAAGPEGPAVGDASPLAVHPSTDNDDVAHGTNGEADFGAAHGALPEEEEEEGEEEEEEYQTSYSRAAALARRPRRRGRGGYGASSLEAAASKKAGGAPATDPANGGRLLGSPGGNDEDDFGLVLGLGLDVEEGAPSSSIFMDTQDNDNESDGGGSEGEESEGEDAGSDTGSVGGDESGEDMSEDKVDARPTGRRKRTAKAEKVVVAARESGEEEEEGPPSEAAGRGCGVGEGRALRAREDRAEEEAEEEADETMDADAMDAAVAALEAEGKAAEAPATAADALADGAPTPAEAPEPTAPAGRCPPAVPVPTSNAELLALVDRLFLAVTDRDAMTVGDINRSVAAHYGWAPDEFKKKERKPLKKMIKARLTALITGQATAGDVEGEKEKKRGKSKKKKVEPQSDEEGEEPFGDDYESAPEENDDNSSDYEEEAPKKKKSAKKTRGKKGASFDGGADSSDEDDASNRKSKKRSSRSKPKGKMAKHLRDRHDRARKRQLEEARIRREELGHLAPDAAQDPEEMKATQGPLVAAPTEEDRRRAVAIARRFDTERDELQMKRAEEREGLLERLRAKRLEGIEAVEIRGEVRSETVGVGGKKDKMDAPRLTFGPAFGTGAGDAKDGAPKEEAPEEAGAKKKNLRVLDDDTSDEEESDDDLEIAAPSSEDAEPSNHPTTGKAKVSVEDLLSGHPSGRPSAHRSDPQRTSKSKILDPRAALRAALTARKVRQGNQLLAHELGRGMTGEQHLRFCAAAMVQRRTEARAFQKRLNEIEAQKQKAAAEDEALHAERLAVESTEIAAADEERALEALGIRREKNGEEDDELAMAARMGLLAEAGEAGAEEEKEGGEDDDAEAPPEAEGGGEDNKPEDDDKAEDDAPSVSSAPAASAPGSVVTPPRGPEAPTEGTAEETSSEAADGSPKAEDTVAAVPGTVVEPKEDGGRAPAGEEKNETTVGHNNNDESPEAEAAGNDATPSTEDPAKDEAPADEEEAEFEEPAAEETGPKKPRNSLWRAELEKEKRREKRQKRLQRKGGGLVEGEAEEDEDDALGIAGLEDFGFTMAAKKDDDDEDAADDELDDDDLDAVVDDVSDGEGDEAAGEAARQKQQRKEEKERHKEIMRRMKEGYDGRRGGIAGGNGGRGNVRFDVLVAAENKAEAKRLGLANDDDYGSEDEEEGEKAKKKGGDDGPEEEEDEAAFLDKMLKDRFLHRGEEEEFIEENFTDDEDSDDEAAGPQDGADDDEDRAQDRAARHFAKRARRNRILEEFGEGDGGFSRSRLIDEDESTRQDLKIMRTSFARKRSVEGSNLDAKENNGASKKPKGASAGLSDAAKPASTFLAAGGSLSVALAASRRGPGRKRKTTFLGGKASASFSRSQSASSASRSVSLSHVVFVAGEGQGAAASRLPDAGSHLGKSRGGPSKKKASRSGSSLWSKVCSKNFRAN
ncbi:hypothetical protein ACHAXT_007867 [Thalassiosira profunda]